MVGDLEGKECLSNYDCSSTVAIAEEIVKDDGWVKKSGIHICPHCIEKLKKVHSNDTELNRYIRYVADKKHFD